jgi:predicted lipid-binding transport protein (Tim44 family)
MQVRKDNEFEFVLGNRQLFSVLAIIVLLLGVFFAMGFFAGRSVGQAAAKAEEGQRHAAENPPIVLEAPMKSEAPPETAGAPPAAAAPASAQPKEPAPAEPAAATAGQREALPQATARPPAAAPEPARPAPERGLDAVGKPAPGSYLQVAATTLSQAQAMAALLRKSDLRTALAPSTKPDLVRVLVGPLASAEASNQARGKLKSLGVDKPYAVKY